MLDDVARLAPITRLGGGGCGCVDVGATARPVDGVGGAARPEEGGVVRLIDAGGGEGNGNGGRGGDEAGGGVCGGGGGDAQGRSCGVTSTNLVPV